MLIRAQPDELSHYAAELARALLHCRVPEWADAEPDTPADALPAEQRLRGMVRGRLCCAPVCAVTKVVGIDGRACFSGSLLQHSSCFNVLQQLRTNRMRSSVLQDCFSFPWYSCCSVAVAVRGCI